MNLPGRNRPHAASPADGAPGEGYRDPRYRGLYLNGRLACAGAARFQDMYKGGPEDLDTLYPEELSPALGRLDALKEDASAFRKRGRRLSNRDLTRLALMESEIATIERRLAKHARRVRGAHLALAEALGRGWKEYILGLGALLFFLEKTAGGIAARLRLSADPGRSSKAIVKSLDDALWAEMESAREQASRIVPPEDLDGAPLKAAKPLLIYLTRPARRSRLLEQTQCMLDALERSRIMTLDLLLAAENRLRELASGCPRAMGALRSLAQGHVPDIPDPKDPREGMPSPYADPAAANGGGDAAPGAAPDAGGSSPDAAGSSLGAGGPSPDGRGSSRDGSEPSPDGSEPAPGGGGSPLDGPVPGPDIPAEAEGRGDAATIGGPGAPAGEGPAPAAPASSRPYSPPGAHEVTHTPQDVAAGLGMLTAPAPAGAGGPSGEPPEAPAAAYAPLPFLLTAEEEQGIPPAPGRTYLRTLLFVSVGLALALIVTYVHKAASREPGESALYVFNGAGMPAVVSLDGAEAFLAPGDRLERHLRGGKGFVIETRAEGGAFVERLHALAPARGGGSLVYSIAGASPFVEWTANYGPVPLAGTGERLLGAPRLFTSRADFILSMPPGSLKLRGGAGTRLSLNPLYGVHPDLMLGELDEPTRRRLIRVHARWEAPDQTFLPLWLALEIALDGPQALPILYERMNDRPWDFWTLRQLLLLLPPSDSAPICRDLERDSREYPGDPGLAYLAALCVGDPESRAGLFPDLFRRFPDYPFLVRAAGLRSLAAGDTAGALEHLKRAFALDSRVALQDIDLLARLSRLEGVSQAEILAEFGPWSPATRRLAAPEGPEEPGPGAPADVIAKRLLHLGRPALALEAAAGPLRREMLLWAAASDGATDDVKEAWRSQFTPADLSVRTAWCDWALSVREGRDPGPAEAFILDNASNPALSRLALDLIRSGDWDDLKVLVQGHDPRFQGQLALALSIVQGDDAPAEARHMAKSYLYIGERPYLD